MSWDGKCRVCGVLIHSFVLNDVREYLCEACGAYYSQTIPRFTINDAIRIMYGQEGEDE